ncbi:hypothetical protein I4I84_20235 [Pseudonocardia sp. KRD-182]|uniref:hypothetical protein n=1 Tax=Pseudonocardia oceani TaxID=2792013 RepID=UPI001C49EC1F|nr:hypothetical protein [Pseudonocardia oceani]MBW0111049.1 hypothetical protein [Pseudonocardia oceani]
MISRVLFTAAGAAGVVLAAIGVMVVPGAIPAWVVIGVAVGVAVTSARSATRARPVGSADPLARRAGVIAGTATVTGFLVATGLATLLGPATWVVVLPLLVIAALPLGWRRWRRGPGGRPVPLPVDAGPAPAPAVLTTAQLRLAWQRSYFALLEGPPGPGQREIVRFREALLDEFERRDRDGFTRWLETGARAGSDPGRYLAPES